MDFLGSLFGSVASGGLTAVFGGISGIIGAAVTKFFEFKMKRLEAEERAKDRQFQLDLMDREWRGRVQVAQAEGEAATEVAASNAFAKSFDLEPKRYLDGVTAPNTWYGRIAKALIYVLMGLLDFWRGLMRPGLCTYSAVLTTWMFFVLLDMMAKYGNEIPSDLLMQTAVRVVDAMLYLLTTSGAWWYGTRTSSAKTKGV
jgi:hypothetical protein